MSGIREKIQGFFHEAIDLLKDNHSSFWQLMIVFVVLVIDYSVEHNLFQCPCHHNALYGGLFLAAPAGVMLVIDVAANRNTRKLLTGCCRGKGIRMLEGTATNVGKIFVRAVIAPMAWLFFRLMDGQYMTCALVVSPCGNITQESAREALQAKASSQTAAWILLSTFIALTTSVMMVCRCCSATNVFEDSYIQIYRKKREAELQRQLDELAKTCAAEDVKNMIQKLHLDTLVAKIETGANRGAGQKGDALEMTQMSTDPV